MIGKWGEAVLDRGLHQSKVQTGWSLQAQQGAPEQRSLVTGVPCWAETARSLYQCSVIGSCPGKCLTRALQWWESLVCSVCPFLWCKYLHHGWFQAAYMTSLNTEIGRDVHIIISPASMSWYVPAHHWLEATLRRLWSTLQTSGLLWRSLYIAGDSQPTTLLEARKWVLPWRGIWATLLFATREMAWAVTYMNWTMGEIELPLKMEEMGFLFV